MKTVIFSGTTEGRRLSEMLSSSGVGHYVCVATEYGNDVMTECDHARVHVGRMDSSEMESYLGEKGFAKGDTVVDATHPYATEVTVNIRKAAESLGCTYIRAARGACYTGPDTPEEDNISKYYVNRYDSTESFAKVADSLEGNILLATGSKELAKYCDIVSKDTISRTFIRVLPSVESLEICRNCGIEPSNIIAMQGPFSYEMNKALMKDMNISHIFTKESGRTGGFEEKLKAASDLSVTVHILERPGIETNQGVSVEEAYRIITGSEYSPKRKIYLVGIGPGSKNTMTYEAADAIRSADAVFGAQRMLDAARSSGLIMTVEAHAMYRPEEIIGYQTNMVNITNVAVLFSGDLGFYSGAKEARIAFTAWDPDADIVMIPGISSVSFLAAKCGCSYDDAVIVSVHGRNSLHNMDELTDKIRSNRKTFALMSGDSDVRTICKMLDESGTGVTVHVGRNLSYGSEEIVTLDAKQGSEYKGEGSITVLFINNEL